MSANSSCVRIGPYLRFSLATCGLSKSWHLHYNYIRSGSCYAATRSGGRSRALSQRPVTAVNFIRLIYTLHGTMNDGRADPLVLSGHPRQPHYLMIIRPYYTITTAASNEDGRGLRTSPHRALPSCSSATPV
jgi:hypothetical protein